MGMEQRQSPRNTVNRPAWVNIGAGAALRDCLLVDISDTGARIELNLAVEMPDIFTLRLTADGRAQHRCHVVWRANNQIGVRFQAA